MRHRGFRVLPRLVPAIALAVAGLCALALAPATSAQIAAKPPLTWSVPVFSQKPPFDSRLAAIESMSCASASLCVGFDDQGALLASTDPAAGASAWHVFTGFLARITSGQVSCVAGSPALCVVANSREITASRSPASGVRTWTTAPVPATDVSCQSTSLCLAGGTGFISYSTNPAGGASAWHTVSLDAGNPILAISCPTSSFCAAVDSVGNVLTTSTPTGSASGWHITDIDVTQAILDIECASASFCVADDVQGKMLTSANPSGGAGDWTGVGRRPITQLSCPSATLCMGVSGHSLAFSTNPSGGRSAWHFFPVGPSPIDTVSCPAVTLCVGANSSGAILSSAQPGGGTSHWQSVQVDGSSLITSIACPATTRCFVTYGANIATSPDPAVGHWTSAVLNTPAFRRTSNIRCPNISLCVVSGTGGVAASTKPTKAGTWHITRLDSGADFLALACPSAHLCVTADNRHHVFISANPAGGRGAWRTFTFDRKQVISSIACPSLTLCVAFDTASNLITTANPGNGPASWHYTHLPFSAFTALTCASTTLCVATSIRAATGLNRIYFSTNPRRGPSAWQHVPTNVRAQSLACPSDSLCVAGDDGQVFMSSSPVSGQPWTPVTVPDEGTFVQAIACQGVTLCLSGDDFGTLFAGTRP